MIFALLGLGLLAGLPAPTPDAPDVARAYQEKRTQAGRTPDDQVRLALWCESHGLPAERLKHLALAVLADPGHATARGLMGLVSFQGKWQRPDAVAEKLKADRKLAETQAAYETRRRGMPDTADAHWRIALWCEENGLEAEADAHFSNVTRLDPSREAAWKRLGYARHSGRWATDAQLAAAKADAEARKQAERTWTPLLEKWKGWLGREDAKRAEAEAGLLAIADPYAVGPIIRVFASSLHPGTQSRAVGLLGRIDTPGSTRALAILAVGSASSEVRRAAMEVLVHRDPREFVGLLIGRIMAPREVIRYELVPDQGPSGAFRFAVKIEDRSKTVLVRNAWGGAVRPGRIFTDDVPFDPTGSQAFQVYGYSGVDGLDGLQVDPARLLGALPRDGSPIGPANLNAALKASVHARTRLDPATALVRQATWAASYRDAEIGMYPYRGNGPNFNATVPQLAAQIDAMNATVDSDNAVILASNAAVYTALRQTTRQGLPDDREAWKTWWIDQLGYSYRSPGRPEADQQPRQVVEYTIISCFAAGTRVRTIAGNRPIEELRVGDRVLAQDTATGALSYRPITRVHHNPPSEVLRVRTAEETILATGFHRFWKAGQGWAMARELKPGDVLRTLGGLSMVESVENDRVQPVFNLDVAEDADYFVGASGALVHDNTLPDPRALPFDAPRAVAGRPE